MELLWAFHQLSDAAALMGKYDGVKAQGRQDDA